MVGWRRLLLVLACIILLIVATNLQPRKPIVIKEHEGILIAHGQLIDPTSGCAKCHSEPIVASCTDCHPSPPTTVKSNIAFPHHDTDPGGPPDNCQSSSCHDGNANDARYVKVLEATHSYCQTCHTLTHSPP